ncbi:hypothetical protein M0805_008921 [Coniferiporia weirii]|nr:hypothetical protein M0805_008921 [Coniferiporia weirii]
MSMSMVGTFDAPMIDFNEDADVPMAGSSGEGWFHQPLSHMDEDTLEVDMMPYDETAEFEMGDEAVDGVDAGTETLAAPNAFDAEVYDVTIHSSPLQPPASGPTQYYESHHGGLETSHDLPELSQGDGEAHQVLLQGDHDTIAQEFSSPSTAHIHEVSLSLGEAQQPSHPESIGSAGKGLALDEPQHTDEPAVIVSQSSEKSDAAEAATSDAPPEHQPSEPGHPVLEGADGQNHGEQQETHLARSPKPLHVDTVHDEHESGIVEYPEEEVSPHGQLSRGENMNRAGADISAQSDYSHVAEHVYLEPPPPILLTLQVTSTEGDQPEFVLFSLPEQSSVAADETEPTVRSAEEPLLLLQHHSSLFYEPISTVFEAFRHEEYFSHIEELSEAEMAINAHDLQLVISEDNIYAREVSLHDLYAMHQGVGLPGHLRLTLQSVVPRFIARYNLLREKITRLTIAEEAEADQQHVPDSVQYQQVHNAHTSIEPQLGSEQEAFEESVLEVHDQSKIADQNSSHDEEQEQEQEYAENAEEGLDTGEPEGQDYGVDDQHTGDERDVHPSFDEPGADGDTVEDLDADGLHAPITEDNPEYEDQATEYVDETELHEEDEEDYGSDPNDNEADGAGTAGGVDSSVPAAEDELEPQAYEDDPDKPATSHGVQAQAMSNSTSSTSLETEGSAWDAEAEEVDASPELKEQTDLSEQKISSSIDEEGNLIEGVESGDDDFGDDDFGDDDFGESSEEGTLDDLTDKSTEDVDAASHAALAESEKFVTDLARSGDLLETNNGSTVNVDVDVQQSRNRASPSPVGINTSDSPSNKIAVKPKNQPKRSPDDAGLDEWGQESQPSSPDPKRARVL